MTKTELAKEYVKAFPNVSKKALSRLLFIENKALFKDEEHARLTIRCATGANGQESRKSINYEDIIIGTQHPTNPYGLPESDESKWEPYVLTSDNYLVLSDIHLPYHSVKALSSAVEYGLKNGYKNVILNGDTLDCYQGSTFVKDPKKRDLAGELRCWLDFIDVLRNHFDGDIVFKMGNHEERYDRLIMARAPELLGIRSFNFQEIMQLSDYDVSFVTDKRPMHFGGLNIIHGHEYTSGAFSPVNIARGLFLRAKSNALQGHNHQTSSHQEANIRGEQTITYSVGCLSELHPAYAPLNRWNWGFAGIKREGNDFEVDNMRINENGRAYK
jgi:predicted phosphodiesterase